MRKMKFIENAKHYYSISIFNKIFKELDFTVDLSGSENIEIVDHEGLTLRTTVDPFTEIEVARLYLKKGWNLRTKFKFLVNFPKKEI